MTKTGTKQGVFSEKGFTLMEMIIAVTLVAMMAVGLWAVFRISLQAWSRGTESIERSVRHRNVLDMVRKQIASGYGLQVSADMKSGTPPYPIFNGTESGFRFISLSSLQFLENPGLTLVTYQVSQDSQGDYSLVETEERYLGENLEITNAENKGKSIPVFGNLISCFFEYFDPGTNEEPARWVKEWDARKEGRLPGAISMTMISRDRNGGSRGRHIVVPIQATAVNMGLGTVNPFGVRRGIRR